MTQYWYMNCPVCQQGRLLVEMRDDVKELFLECEECSRAWRTPEQVSVRENAFLALDIGSHAASEEEIRLADWQKYKFHMSVK